MKERIRKALRPFMLAIYAGFILTIVWIVTGGEYPWVMIIGTALWMGGVIFSGPSKQTSNPKERKDR